MDAVQPRHPDQGDVLHQGHSARHRAEKHVTHGLQQQQQQQRYAWRKVRPGPLAAVVPTREQGNHRNEAKSG